MHNKIPIKIFIFNNGGYLTIKQTQILGFSEGLWGQIKKAVYLFQIMKKNEIFDYIIIGSGPTACFSALSLSENLKSPTASFIE